METYDSTKETQKHISRVRVHLNTIRDNMESRWQKHDASKLESPEKEAFDSLGPPEVMAKLEYGSEEYKANLRKIKPAIQHHYAVNDHHPEHFKLWKCPLCKKVFRDSDFENDKRDPHFCQSCVPNGTMYEAVVEPYVGVDGMSLMGLLEMLADWKAAGERHTTGNLRDSLAKNKDRFGISDQLLMILENTAKELGWL